MSFFGINGGEMLVIVILALVLLGPDKLPRYAQQLAELVRQGKAALQSAKARVDAELGDELKDIEWERLDPRQYDPRRIVKEALLDDAPGSRPGAPAGATGNGSRRAAAVAPAAPVVSAAAALDGPAPFDDEAT